MTDQTPERGIQGYNTATGELRCCQCGRVGTRGFLIFPRPLDRIPGGERFIVCANSNACRKRWPVETEDALDARLA